MVVYRTLTHFC